MNPFPTEDSTLEEEIARVYSQLNTFNAETKEYEAAVNQLSKLYKLKNDQSKLNLDLHQHADSHAIAQQQMDAQYDLDNRPFYARVSPDAALTVAGNLIVALIVVKYEQTGVISTQIRNFIKKI